MFRFVAFTLACLALAACSRSGAPRASDDRLVIAQVWDPKSLDTIYADGATSAQLDGLLYSQLTSFDGDGTIVPRVASVVPTLANGGIAPDGLHVTYHLRHDVRWQDGVPLTARDVVFTYRAVMNPRNAVASRYGFDRIVAIGAPDPYTVVMTLKRPYAPIVATVFGGDSEYGILPSHLLERYASLDAVAYNQAPIASGPYRLKSWIRGDSETWTAFDGWYAGRPRVRTIVVKIVPDVETIVNQLRTGEVDASFVLSPRQVNELRGLPGQRVLRTPVPELLPLFFNMTDPIVSDIAVRRALALGIDRRALVRDRYANLYDPESGMRPFFGWAYDANVDRIAYDSVAARAILTRDGWLPGPDGIRSKAGRPLDLDFLVRDTSEAVAVEIAAQAARLGIRLRIKTATVGRIDSLDGPLERGRYQVALTGIQASNDPDPSWMFACAQRSPAGFNFMRYCNRAVDELLARASSTYDRAARTTYLVAAQRQIVHDLPLVALMQESLLAVVPTDMHGLRPSYYENPYASAGRWSLAR